ncbi:unnamed protein product, partial [Gordionus sp. m RMFG-2023]
YVDLGTHLMRNTIISADVEPLASEWRALAQENQGAIEGIRRPMERSREYVREERDRIICYGCGEAGHIRRWCPRERSEVMGGPYREELEPSPVASSSRAVPTGRGTRERYQPVAQDTLVVRVGKEVQDESQK